MTKILLDSLMPIFVAMALGYIAGWTRDIDNHHVAELNALVMDFALPLSLFVAMARTPRALLLAQWPLLLVLVVSMLVLQAARRSQCLHCVQLSHQQRLERLGLLIEQRLP
jgi:malonate transporter